MQKVAQNRPFRYLLVLISFVAAFALAAPRPAQAAEKLTPQRVADLIPQLFTLHLSQRDMDAPFMKRLLKQFVNQLDPAKSFFLKGEAEAVWNLSDDELLRLARQSRLGDFSHFRKLLASFLDTQVAHDAAFFDGLEKRAGEIKALALRDSKAAAEIKDPKPAGDGKDKAAAEANSGTPQKAASETPAAAVPEAPKDAAAPPAKAGSDEDPDKIEWSERAPTQAEREKRLLRMAAMLYKVNKTYLSGDEAIKLAVQNVRDDRNKWLTVNIGEEVPKLFLKSFMAAMDPHTDYFDADEDEFTDRLERSFEGIGVQIRPCPLGAQVDEVIKGGPSAKSGQFAKRDQIVAVDDFTLAGLPINKIVKRIKGKIGTEVKITLLKYDTKKTEVVTLKRDKIDLAETRVKGKKYETAAGAIGLISVQTFYKDVHRDVRDRLRELSAEKPLAGVVLDLRSNHGGYLDEAVGLAGLFLESGPVVGEKDGAGEIDWKYDPDARAEYLGPMVVLVNQFSASASEIVAGALKDYGRAVVVGASQTFGKGTVQRVISLKALNLPGEIKITTHQYFLPAGASVQLHGVEPDVTIPGYKLLTDDGMLEKSSENAVAWRQIKGELNNSVPDTEIWHAWAAKQVPALQELSKARVAANPEFKDAFDPKKSSAQAAAEEPDAKPGLDDDSSAEKKKDLQADEAVAVAKDMAATWPKITAHATAK